MPTAPPCVLIVDAEPQVCQLICRDLSESGFECTTTTDPNEAKDLIESRRYDLLIADVLMPKTNGLNLLAHAKRHSPDSKVILITGASSRECLTQALMLGAYDYLEKPFSASELIEVASMAVGDAADIPHLPVRAAEAMEQSLRAEHTLFESVRALARAVEAKDPYTRRHSEHVTHYATNIARLMNLPDTIRESVRIASQLHDIGKIGVPDYILTKPGRLSKEELDCVRAHPALGADILANITLFAREAKLVRHHHEFWNGRGYPDGLSGEDIPLGSRIIGVADAMDAMLMERTYKQPYPVEKMLDQLMRCSMQFDQRIALLAVRWCRMNPDELIVPGGKVPTAV